jgi:hypothetical protein
MNSELIASAPSASELTSEDLADLLGNAPELDAPTDAELEARRLARLERDEAAREDFKAFLRGIEDEDADEVVPADILARLDEDDVILGDVAALRAMVRA